MWKIAPEPNATQRFETCYQAQTFGAFVILSGPKILPVSETVVPMRKINLRLKFLLLSILPLVLAAAAISYLVFAQAERLAEAEIRTFERNILEARKEELKSYLELALASIDHIYSVASPLDAVSKERVKSIIEDLSYGEDGYFFIYDRDGTALVDPPQPWRLGRTYWNLRDLNGNSVIQALIFNAEKGGGFLRHVWEKPSTGEPAEKIAYSLMLEKWGWMIGTGIYIDDISEQVKEIETEVSSHIRDTTISIVGITILAVLLVGISGTVVTLSERKLADSKLKELTHRVVDVQEQERLRVSRELHDGISQILVSVKYSIETAIARLGPEKNAATEPMEKAAKRLQDAIHEVRRISRDLRPAVLDDLGLRPAIESMCKELADRSDMQIDVKSDNIDVVLDIAKKTTLYRVLQETLTNIERHADATHIKVTIRREGQSVVMKIIDNGVGFETNRYIRNRDPRAGIGLRNMRERMEFHGGGMTVKSEPDDGTTITAYIPVSRDNDLPVTVISG
ncbi:two-component system, NarL family, sensor kinase [Thalassospira xiamenensis M-5 = DSM 17429]|uniref:Oxygen sensor histidine kinase NreB n=2 Tax=Thalassospira xiamenensis TaxID=220697 RepID=A0AB72UHJ3_9PROT|nr:sensor histidine kinase [Thalassospira xiamenensis M-5 = DSM 17429]SIS50889.1 two-component system, NarL family, sensor kinase [Thalassospira xiamenensis M-5 = DSM 17429]